MGSTFQLPRILVQDINDLQQGLQTLLAKNQPDFSEKVENNPAVTCLVGVGVMGEEVIVPKILLFIENNCAD